MTRNIIPIARSYKGIASEINNWILSKKYDTGERIPTTLELHKIFKVNPVTITRAINVLKQKGVVEAKRGIGIIVANNIPTLKNIDLVVFMPDYVLGENLDEDVNLFIMYRIFKGIMEEINKLGISSKFIWHSNPAERIIQSIDKNSSHLTWYISRFYFGVKGKKWVNKEQRNRNVFININQDKFSGKGISVVPDFKPGIEDAVNYYYRCGKRKYAIIYGDNKFKTCKARYDLYINTLKQKSIKVPKNWQIECINGYEKDGYEASEKLYKNSKIIPEVIFCVTDYRAIGVKRFFLERKLPVPCILGFDNVSLGLKENIDTIDIRLDEIGKVAVKSIDDFLNKKIVLGQEISVSSKFILRAGK